MVQPAEQPDDLLSRFAIKVTGGLIGQQNSRRGDQRPGDCNTLALAAGQICGPVPGTMGQADFFQLHHRSLPCRGQADAAVIQWQRDIVENGQAGQQIEALEHKAQQAVSGDGALIGSGMRHVATVQYQPPPARLVEQADQVE